MKLKNQNDRFLGSAVHVWVFFFFNQILHGTLKTQVSTVFQLLTVWSLEKKCSYSVVILLWYHHEISVLREMTSGVHIYKWNAAFNIPTACLWQSKNVDVSLGTHWIYCYITVYSSVTKVFSLSELLLSWGKEIKYSIYGQTHK